jgi:paraquat-inducible protein A
MTLTIVGVKLNTTITGAAYIFYQQGSPELAAIVWLPSVFIPGVIILSLFYVLFSVRFQMNWRYAKPLLVLTGRLLPWGMMDVFMLGILVSIVKLVGLADVVIGTGFYAFAFLVVLYASTIASLETHTLWERLTEQPGSSTEPTNG